MRTTLVARSVVAVAALAIGSAALSAVPAEAATRSGITRDMVLTAAAGVRSAPGGSTAYGPAAKRALKAMANRACGIDPDGSETYLAALAGATAPGGSAEGVVVTAVLTSQELGDGSPSPDRLCTFGALATTAGGSTLSGRATVSGSSYALSGDVFATPGRRIALSASPDLATAFPTFKASGNAVRSVVVKIKDTKTSQQKRAAKKKYAKRLAAAKKAYAKALKKAGGSSSKKAAAKRTYKAKRTSAKAKYRSAIASYQLRTVKVPTPFSVTAQAQTPS